MATCDDYQGGYEFKFVTGEPRDEYQCHICTLVARDPRQVTCCSNIYCKSCLDTLKEKGQGFICPTCRSSLEGKYFKDGRAEREIKSLKVYCTNTDSGCQWMGTIKDIDTHLNNSCTYQLVPCTNCGAKMRRSKLMTHLINNCPKRMINCQYCKERGTHQLITSSSHTKECTDLPIQCSNEGCNEKVPRCSLASHNETCPKAIIPCEYNTVGCNKKMKREEQEKHNEESMKQHLDIAMKKIEVLQVLLPTNHVLKLNEYREKKEGDEIWFSPGFYTSPGGYKMSLRVDVNGDRDGKGTHVSCFIYLMAGEYDDILEWPFQGEVTIELLNELEDKNHKKCTLSFNESTPDISKQRVKEGRNTGWGKKFISHEELEYDPATNCQYLKDDSLYFRVSVKITPKTKPWLVLR
ncbi:PREDICTED: TNF receptor-associated factor 5-like [Amphimedon queenslandica]|uniref:RING-type E3 ubiquitin transferase n=2 Tax=Amphimedon queenslandica TaxID=400682 RepID=A0AAN0II57_AMPQE|nr:PREDICTED: TNF receptor-associated factor 5-like [Amphimedon queenslandica]|eukprot:XP_003390492.1 PREDICTED: TNF receptor-associated factor 5-like [Amphimedon queenslandica]